MYKEQVFKTTITFVLLLVAGIGLAVSARFLQQPIEQMVMVGVGSALVGGSLAFYLNQMFNLNRGTSKQVNKWTYKTSNSNPLSILPLGD